MKSVKRTKKDNLHIEIRNYLIKHSGYKHKVVQDYLREVYSGVCCYCESIFEHSASMNIEHFYPKDYKNIRGRTIYKDYENTLCNLHYSCPKCNNIKNAKDPDGKKSKNKKHNGTKIYSPNFILKKNIGFRKNQEDDFELSKIKVETRFTFSDYRILAKNKNDIRARGTIEMFDLNGERGRKYLLHERQKNYIHVVNRLKKINKILGILESSKDKELLEFLDSDFYELSLIFRNNHQYSSMNRKLFLGLFGKLKTKYEQIKANLSI